MSEKMTRIRLPNSKSRGLLDWGEHSFEEMVEQMRTKARHDLVEATEVLAAVDSDFEVAVVRGPYVQHFIKQVLPHQATKGE